MNMIIISGAEATCKTAIGKEIARSLGYKYQSKDMIKEHLFDTESKTTWSYRWYEQRAKQQLFHEVEAFIQNGSDVVIESNFIGEDKKALEKILQNNPIKLAEIYCYAKGLVSFKRFVYRNETKVRHSGHHDRRWYLSVFYQCCLRSIGIRGKHRPVGISSKCLKVDTTDYSEIDFQKIIKFATSDK